MTKKKYILITGVAGFVGFSLAYKLASRFNIIGIDSINNYYDTKIKHDRLKLLKKKGRKKFKFFKIDISNRNKINQHLLKFDILYLYHFAAQAGVRHSLKFPEDYVKNNLVGFFNILDFAKTKKVKHFIYASTSSVYGLNEKNPLSEKDSSNHPGQFYAATKKSNEMMAHSYSQVFNLPTTGLRFFTIYGPWGRPDMALFKFVKNIIQNKPIEIFNYGNHSRDFTYIDDLVNVLFLLKNKIPKRKKIIKVNDPSSSSAPFQILNIGNEKKVKLMEYVSYIEKCLKIKAKKKYLPLQKGDIKSVLSNMNKTNKLIGSSYYTPFQKGIREFVKWYKNYYRIKLKI